VFCEKIFLINVDMCRQRRISTELRLLYKIYFVKLFNLNFPQLLFFVKNNPSQRRGKRRNFLFKNILDGNSSANLKSVLINVKEPSLSLNVVNTVELTVSLSHCD